MAEEKKEGTERRRIKVLIREEDMEAVKGQGGKWNGFLPEGTDVVEGQVYILRVPKPGDQIEDVEGQASKYVGLGQTEEDVEGQAGHWGLEPATAEDVEGHNGRWNGFLEIEDDTDGQGRKFHFVPEDDTEGQSSRYTGLAAEEPDDTEGHQRGAGRPPVDR